MPARLTQNNKIEIIFLYGHHRLQNDAYRKTAVAFNRANPGHHLAHSAVFRLIKHFKSTGSVKDLPRKAVRTVTNRNTTIDVCAMFRDNPRLSTRSAATESNISRHSIQRILKSQKFKPYKNFLSQVLKPGDSAIRNEFCVNMLQRFNQNANMVGNIIFSDECVFYLSGNVNQQNCRFWDTENPHLVIPAKEQGSPRVMVWCGLSSMRLFGPFFFINENITAANYLIMLQQQFFPIFQASNLVHGETFFQHDGAPPHYGLLVRQWLNDMFPERWIGRSGPIGWPARSPDLTPLDFYLWGFLKSKVFLAPKPDTIDQLCARITEVCQTITADILHTVADNFAKRLQKCHDCNGELFEHRL